MKSYGVPINIADEGTTTTSEAIPAQGKLRGIVVNAPEISGISYTVTVFDKNGIVVFTRSI